MKIMDKSKRGAVSVDTLYIYAVQIMFTVILIAFVLLLTSLLASKELDSSALESSIIAQRLVYEKGGISIFDEDAGRVLPLEIDLASFSSGEQKRSLDRSIDGEEYAAAIFLYKGIRNASVIPKAAAKTYYNEEKYKIWSPVGDAKKTASARRSAGNIQRFDFEFPVTIHNEAKKEQGWIEVYVYHPQGSKR